MNKRLYRTNNGKKLFGVCQGLAIYFDIDPTIIRLIWVLISLGSVGAGLLVYLIIALILPVDPIE